jgi:hypothetical protein
MLVLAEFENKQILLLLHIIKKLFLQICTILEIQENAKVGGGFKPLTLQRSKDLVSLCSKN